MSNPTTQQSIQLALEKSVSKMSLSECISRDCPTAGADNIILQTALRLIKKSILEQAEAKRTAGPFTGR